MDLPNSPDRSANVTATPAPLPAPAPPEDAPLTARGWLAQNGLMMLLLISLGAFLFSRVGFEGLAPLGLAALGLGFLIFIHELGHFAAAKWCDVHVKTFSIGFGPAVPGLHYTLGETTYMIGILPLGGYVNMVGEGTEADEDEHNPRSFKSKGVLQRMFIISAGVIMNVLFGLACFVAVFRFNGVDRPPAIVSRTEAGSPAWEQGVRAGWKVSKIDGRTDPYFDDLRYAVANSAHGAVLPFQFTDRDGKIHDREIEPIRDENSPMPVIGVAPPSRLKLLPAEVKRVRSTSYNYDSAAAFARVVPLERGDAILTIDGEPAGKSPWQALAARLLKSADGDIKLTVRRAGGKEEAVTLSPGGFAFGDAIVGTTDAATPAEPFNVTALPLDPNQEAKRELGDPFAFRERLTALAKVPMVMEVRRGKDKERLKVLVPPAYTRDFGLRMKMGKVAAVRLGSGAAKVGLVKGDEIIGVGLRYKQESVDWLKDFDPVRLPDLLYDRVHADPARKPADYSVVFKVKWTKDHDLNGEKERDPIAWDDSYGPGDEAPSGPTSPTSIAQLGVAYHVDSMVVAVRPDSPAAKAGLLPGDEIVEMRIRDTGKTPDKEKWTEWTEMASNRGKGVKLYDQWAHYHWLLQRHDSATVEFRVKRGGELLMKDAEPAGWLGWLFGKRRVAQTFGPIEAEPDPTWPMAERGLLLTPDTRRQKAESMGEAAWLGLERSTGFIKNILLNLRGLLTGRISSKSLGGPILIAEQAYSFANEDWFVFAQFLGIISINLAVVNFLPIPVLDGGHMVFLLYEWVRGRPPSEAVRNTATYIGVALLLSLMAYVFFVDLTRPR